MHAFARLFISDLNANDCRVFDWLGAHSKNDEKHLCLLVMLTTSIKSIYIHFMTISQTPILGRNASHIVRLITEGIL